MPDHSPNTTRGGASDTETEAYAKTHTSECLHNPMMGEDRRCARDRKEANEMCQAEAKLTRENALQEGADTDDPTRRNHRGQETTKGDMPEKSCQGQRAETKELPKGSNQDQGIVEETTKAHRDATEDSQDAASATHRETTEARNQGGQTTDTGPPKHATCTCPWGNWCICGASRTTEKHLQPRNIVAKRKGNTPGTTTPDKKPPRRN